MAEPSGIPVLAADRRRNGVALLIAAAGTAVAFAVYGAFIPIRFTIDAVVVTAFVFWVLYAASTAILTHVVFRGVDGERLATWLLATTRRGSRGAGVVAPRQDVVWALLAVVAVGLIVVLPGLLDSPLANSLGFAVVLSSWVVTVYGYAVHYARLDAVEASFAFPGKKYPPVFDDVLYLSVQLATTFSSSDVDVLTTRARRVVTGQTLIAYAYTTFIIAMLITVLFLGN